MISKRIIYTCFLIITGFSIGLLYLKFYRTTSNFDLYSVESVKHIRRRASLLCGTQEYLFNEVTKDAFPIETTSNFTCVQDKVPRNLLYIKSNYIRASKRHPWYRKLDYCLIKTIKWSSDNKINESKSQTMKKRKRIRIKEDFVLAECIYHKTNRRLHQFMVHTQTKPIILDRIKKLTEKSTSRHIRPDVLILHLGQIDIRHRESQLPITSKILRKWQPIKMQGITAMGASVQENMLPLIMGKSVKEIQDAINRRKANENEQIDSRNSLWQYYKDHGYATLFAENAVDYGIFTRNKLPGFRKQPVDHYLRTFWLAISYINKDVCINGRARHEYVFDYLKDFYRTYRNTSKLAIAVHHDNVENNLPTKELDSSLAKLFSFLNETGISENLVILLMGNSQKPGNTGGEYLHHDDLMRQLMLYGEIVVPAWFKRHHRDMGENLIRNTGRFLSPYDLHVTLNDFLYISDSGESSTASPQRHPYGHSLLRAMPQNKDCQAAGIAPGWCTCIDWQIAQSQSTTNQSESKFGAKLPDIREATKVLIKYLNRIVRNYRYICKSIENEKLLYSEYFTVKTEEKRSSLNSSFIYMRLMIGIPHQGRQERFVGIVEYRKSTGKYRATGDFVRLSEERQDCTSVIHNSIIERACLCVS